MVALASSPEYCRGLLCVRKDILGEYKWLLEESLLALHEEPRGKQILTLFRVDRIIPFDASRLESVMALVEEYSELGKGGEEGE